MRFRVSKVKLTRGDLKKLIALVDTKSNKELSEMFGIPLHALQNLLTRYRIRRDPECATVHRGAHGGEEHHNWKGGVSKDSYRYKKIQKERYPERDKAREAVRRAVKKGTLTHQPCEVCGSTENVQAHHDSYAKEDRLKINWLCKKHHDIADRARREREKKTGSAI
jgi:hypothetical protein